MSDITFAESVRLALIDTLRAELPDGYVVSCGTYYDRYLNSTEHYIYIWWHGWWVCHICVRDHILAVRHDACNQVASMDLNDPHSIDELITAIKDQ